MIGSALGHFTITNHLGSGGMGEVYQATDAKLGRDVAVKFLSEAFVHDTSHLARLQREARALAALNHPHVAAIYGLEELGGRHFLVMELVRGTTLATKLAGGRLSIDDTIRYGTQIADALAAAHARGIVHRDLKPGNIMVAKPGVKVLDFGLAKSADGVETLTRTEAILGTPAYMAPEQREGGACDSRSDIYSFGLVLLEMATGQRGVEGDVLKRMPAQLARVIQGCLERDPDARWQSAADIKRALAWAAIPVEREEQASRGTTWAAVAACAGIIVGAASIWFFRSAPANVQRIVRFEISQAGPSALTISDRSSDLALIPDGSGVVYVGDNGTQLFVRRFDNFEPMSIARGTDIWRPFVSPDSQRVGYFDNERVLKLAPIEGGPSVTLSADGTANGTWLDENTIVLGAKAPNNPLRIVYANTPAVPAKDLTRVDTDAGEVNHSLPHALPDGHSILFSVLAKRNGVIASHVFVFDTRTSQKREILSPANDPRYVADPNSPNGYLAYTLQDALWTIGFDLKRLAVHGQPMKVPAHLVTDTVGTAEFAINAGMLAYVDAPERSPGSAQSTSIVWVDWSTGIETLVGPSGPYIEARISPDESKIALVARKGGQRSLQILDVQRRVLVPLPIDPVSFLGDLVWLPGGKEVVYRAAAGLWKIAVDGTGKPERLLTSNNSPRPTSASPDGHLVFQEAATGSLMDILRMRLDGSHSVTPLLQTSNWESGGVVSPDRRWIAYECCRGEQPDIWVRAYPTGEGGLQVSSGGGRRASWSRAGDHDQVFYVAPDGEVMRAPVDGKGSALVVLEPPMPVKAISYGNHWIDISSDGRRLLTLKPADPRPPSIHVVLDWVAELGRASQ